MSEPIEKLKQQIREDSQRKIELLDELSSAHEDLQGRIDHHQHLCSEAHKLGLTRSDLNRFQLKLGNPTNKRKRTNTPSRFASSPRNEPDISTSPQSPSHASSENER